MTKLCSSGKNRAYFIANQGFLTVVTLIQQIFFLFILIFFVKVTFYRIKMYLSVITL